MIKFLKVKASEQPLWIEHIKTRISLRDINLKHWLDNNLFTPVWWLMLIIFIATWIIWWKFVDKTKLMEIVIYGLMVSFLATILDLIGTEFVLWGYPNMLLPLMPPLAIVDLGVLPVVFMLIYQFFAGWKSFFIAMIITSLAFSFIGEPIAVWFDMYQINNWRHLYSFPLYIILGLTVKWFVHSIITKEKKSSQK